MVVAMKLHLYTLVHVCNNSCIDIALKPDRLMFHHHFDNTFKSTKIYPAHSLDSIRSNSSVNSKHSRKSRLSTTFGNILRPARQVGRVVKGPFEFGDCLRGSQKRTSSNGLMMCIIVCPYDLLSLYYI